MDAHHDRSLVVASNRGPVTLVPDESGNVTERRGVGGLVTAVGDALRGRDGTWIAAPMSDADRARATERDPNVRLRTPGGEILRVRFIDVEQELYDPYYNDFSNRVLWFLHHYLWDPVRPPAFGRRETDAWDAYQAVNRRFADMLASEAGEDALALPHDYHLSLVPGMLRRSRGELPIGLFWHIPFCRAGQLSVIGQWGGWLLEGMLGADVVGFHTKRWANNFADCCRAVLGAQVRNGIVKFNGRSTRVGVYPLGVDQPGLRAEAERPEVAAAVKDINEIAGDRKLIVRVDRTELSKNILRGLIAYGAMLERRRDLHGRVVHLVMLTPSREDVLEYREYMAACEARAHQINDRFGTATWQPIVLEISDDFARSLAAYRRYDVLVVNPVYDGMNLVAKEGPLLNERDGVLVLSTNAGAAAELGPGALLVDPYNQRRTSLALEAAVDMPAEERRRRGQILRELAPGMSPSRWLEAQIDDLARAPTLV